VCMYSVIKFVHKVGGEQLNKTKHFSEVENLFEDFKKSHTVKLQDFLYDVLSFLFSTF
jgi:hypothetical protein